MDKAPMEVQTEKMDGETTKEAEMPWWDVSSVGANGKYRLPDDYVRSTLALPRSKPHEEIAYLQTPNLAQLLGVTEESLEEDRRRFYGEEAAARTKRINDSLVLFQDNFREQWERQGYVEVDEEYITNIIKMQAYNNQLEEKQDWSDFPCADPRDPAYATWFEHCTEEEIAGWSTTRYCMSSPPDRLPVQTKIIRTSCWACNN